MRREKRKEIKITTRAIVLNKNDDMISWKLTTGRLPGWFEEEIRVFLGVGSYHEMVREIGHAKRYIDWNTKPLTKKENKQVKDIIDKTLNWKKLNLLRTGRIA